MEFKFISILLLLAQLYIVSSYHAATNPPPEKKTLRLPVFPRRLIHSGDRQPHIQPADDNIRGRGPPTISLHHVHHRPNFLNITRCFMCINKTTSILYHPIKSFAVGMRILTCGSDSYLGLLRNGDTFPYPSYSNHVLGGGGNSPAAATGVVLGCGTEIGLIRILGLYPGYPMSLVGDRGPRFSYCMGPTITDREKSTLVVGKRAKMLGRPTPLELYDNRYYLTLMGISVGKKLLDIDPKIFESTPLGERGVVIDTGTTYTYLIRPAYYALRTHIAEVVQQGSWNVTLKKFDDRLCYYGTVKRDMRLFRQVTLHFAGGVNLSADAFGIFNHEDKDYFCLAFMETPARYMPSQVGLMVQRGYNFGFDPSARKLYIENVRELK